MTYSTYRKSDKTRQRNVLAESAKRKEEAVYEQ